MPHYNAADDTQLSFYFAECGYSYMYSVCVKYGLSFTLYLMTVLALGTEKHHDMVKPLVNDYSEFGCFALTELGHGSNV